MTMSGTAIVTGAARGLGLQIARRFVLEDLDLLVLADIDEAAVKTAAAELANTHTQIIATGIEVSNRDAVKAMVESAIRRTGRLDTLVNNAGVLSPSGRIHNLGVDDWERSFKVNLMGAVNGIWAAVPHMRNQGGGTIINTASVAGITPFAYAAPYSASKAAIIALTKCAAIEYARDNIRVNCVCPGTFVSAIHDGLPEEALDSIAQKHPLGLGRPQDVAGAFSYLAAAEQHWITGSALVVDGGYSAQ
jgi:NAD(P)-dependent dehydrogenase (short-subunit alcohol dehydrogenase family)